VVTLGHKCGLPSINSILGVRKSTLSEGERFASTVKELEMQVDTSILAQPVQALEK